MIRTSVISVLLVLSFCACNSDAPLPDHTGAYGEVVVVMNAVDWEGELGGVVRSMLAQPVRGLPQPEPRFKLLHYTATTMPPMLRTHRNILFAEIGPDQETGQVRKLNDRWAQGQQFVQVVAPNHTEWLSIFNAKAGLIMDQFDLAERRRLQHVQAGQADAGYKKILQERIGLSLNVPSEFIVALNEPEFLHLRRDRMLTSRSTTGGGGMSQLAHQVIDGIFVYSYPYSSDSTFTRPYLMNRRDSLLKRWVPGHRKDSYMGTQRFFQDLDLRPSLGETLIDSTYATEMRGLWGMVGGAKMGGPFISVSTLSPDGKMVIAIEGYCHAPQFDKREFLRYVDAIVYSAKFVN